MSKRPKVVYEERYKKGRAMLKKELLPILKHAAGFMVDSCEVHAVGLVEVGDKKMEFQDLRIYLREFGA